MYSSGKAVHESVQWLFMSNPRRYEKEKYVEYNDIEGSIDIFDKKRNTPIEFKTLRSSNIEKPKSFQEEQLRYYMAMQSSPIGYMIYQCLMHLLLSGFIVAYRAIIPPVCVFVSPALLLTCGWEGAV